MKGDQCVSLRVARADHLSRESDTQWSVTALFVTNGELYQPYGDTGQRLACTEDPHRPTQVKM